MAPDWFTKLYKLIEFIISSAPVDENVEAHSDTGLDKTTRSTGYKALPIPDT